MSILEIARDTDRTYVLTLQLRYQSIGEIVGQWGPMANVRVIRVMKSCRGAPMGVKDLDTARELSATIGDYGVLSWAEGQNTGSPAGLSRRAPAPRVRLRPIFKTAAR